MTSLAMSAALFNEDTTDNNANNYKNTKKVIHDRTQKNRTNDNYLNKINTEKVNTVLESIHNNNNSEEEDDLGNYYANPPPKPKSIGVEKAKLKENMQNVSLGNLNFMEERKDLDLNNIQDNYFKNDNEKEEYYRKFIPNFSMNDIKIKEQEYKKQNPYYINSVENQSKNNERSNYMNMNMNMHMNSNDILLQKLNYMIHLLEEKQDEKTNNVTEEVILYSFLGIFIIFIVDSFTRVGKYTR